MQFGVHIFPTEHSIQPCELARAVEERELDSLWFSEHTHIPVRFLNAPGRGASLPNYYWQTYDIFVAMTLAAIATKNIKIATGVSLVIERDPILLAKETATFDLLSKGRLIFGVGAGWLESEMADHGVVYRTRFQLLKEQLRAIKEIWTTDESEFHGRFVNFDKMKAFPKPYQRPHPPIVMGGAGAKAIECAAEVCDGWAPWLPEWPEAKELIAELKQQVAARGRDPEALEISVFEKSIPDKKIIAEMETAGVKSIILTIFSQSREEALPALDGLAKINR
ncbi:MAG TPA: LLM class F420-dependent oxidoreductase [Anaerolineales bacterium]|nr:LLM class F420-dependent oxidoreductase [Anaerolineales bacterium]